MSNKITPLRKAKWVCKIQEYYKGGRFNWFMSSDENIGIFQMPYAFNGSKPRTKSQALLDAKNFCKVNGFKARFEK